MNLRELIEHTGAFTDDEELTPRHVTTLVGTLAVLGVVSYLIAFVDLGY